jgi:3-oxoacyl-[acyl-carrier-protein] synthase-3
MQAAGVTPDQVDHYLLHQANIRIIDTIREYMKQGWEKFPHFIEKYGNTSSSSIPMLLDEMAREGKIKDGDRIAMSAFGAGFTTAACLLKWSEIKYE